MEDGWNNWAGPPDKFVADGESSSEELASKLGKAGVLYVPGASWAPWQKGKVERNIQIFTKVLRKTVLTRGIAGKADMKTSALEVIAAIN